MNSQIKKIIPYCLILVILVGLFSPMVVSAAINPDTGLQEQSLTELNQQQQNSLTGQAAPAGAPTGVPAATPTTTPTPAQILTTTGGSALAENNGSCTTLVAGDIEDCLVKLAYYVFYVFPAFLLTLVAKLFNILIALTLSSSLYKASFVSGAWIVVRDLSNIFFILILLYIAIQTILGLGHETKKMIARVVIMALLINFSMFFTKVIIDSSNILALVFYNKINTESKDYIPSTKISKTGVQEKDISGGIVSAFDPTRLMTADFFKKAKEKTQSVGVGTIGTAGYVAGGAYIGSFIPIPIVGTVAGAAVGYGVSKVVGLFITTDKVPPGLMIGIIVSAGLIMLFAAYCFFIAGMSFLGRLVELWILIIFSPFAFMSSALPKLAGVEYIGWESWIKRLVKVAFMAPIFMFFLYLIFKLINLNIFQTFMDRTYDQQGTLEAIVLILLPSLVILILLLKITKWAKDASGELGSMVISGAKLVAGLAVGGAALGGAAILRGSMGAVAKSVQSNDTARRNAFTFKDARDKWNQGGFVNRTSAISSAITNLPKAAAARSAQLVHDAKWNKESIGKKLQEADKGFSEKTHATHILDAKMQQEFGHQYGKDAKYKDLTEREQGIVKKEVDKDELAKKEYGANFQSLEAVDKQKIMQSYDNGERIIEDEHTGTKTKVAVVNPTTGAITLPPNNRIMSDVIVANSKSNVAIGEFVQALRKGTYDIRNLPDMNAKTKGFPKLGVGLIATVASGVRLGLKKGGGVEYGTVQGNVFKDLGDTISEALKNVKINVSSGGHDGGDDHGTKEIKSVGH